MKHRKLYFEGEENKPVATWEPDYMGYSINTKAIVEALSSGDNIDVLYDSLKKMDNPDESTDLVNLGLETLSKISSMLELNDIEKMAFKMVQKILRELKNDSWGY